MQNFYTYQLCKKVIHFLCCQLVQSVAFLRTKSLQDSMEQISTLCFVSGFAWTALALLPFVFGCTKNSSNKATKGAPAPMLNAAQIKPQVIPKNAKEELIAKGELKKGKHDYPTMDDVISDWDSEKDNGKGRKKSAEKVNKKGDTKGKGKKKSVDKAEKKANKKEDDEDSKTPPKDKDEKEEKEADDADKHGDKKEETSKK
ncbi:hypothetical protein M3Y97_00165000 [Aphelenchoides bicaudatus]|nr:hypothetical protein M3Y97_00165000 [Aphelenchoides bicaudatus]